MPQPTTLELNTLKRKDFKKVNGYITCNAEEYWLGIDVSFWQEEIDWEKVAASGVQFAMIRMAYRGWSKDAELQMDVMGEQNLQGAMAAGIKVGVYIYSQATNVQEAVEEAQFLLKLLDGRDLDMPVVFDWEVPVGVNARTEKVKAKTIHACALAFCAEIKAAGYQPMVYFNQWQGMAKYNLAELREAGIELWLAMYSKAMTYDYKVQMWQYTSKGRVPGIDGRVDIDLYFPNH
jgi:GH25 family lysozyme M1 (1,4-beta-N-acetylmuramidase)